MRLRDIVVSTVVLAAFGCGGVDDPPEEVVLTMRMISGLYYGVTFTTEEDGVVTDQLRRGSSIEIWLYIDGRTDGRLFVPADSAGGANVDESLFGTWALNGNVVTLDHANDTVLREIDFVFVDTYMVGETTRDGVTYRISLAM